MFHFPAPPLHRIICFGAALFSHARRIIVLFVLPLSLVVCERFFVGHNATVKCEYNYNFIIIPAHHHQSEKQLHCRDYLFPNLQALFDDVFTEPVLAL
jgi:hypothetical protein